MLSMFPIQNNLESSETFPGCFWKIKDAQGHKAYLLGSIHSDFNAIINKDSKIWRCFEKVSLLAAEMDPTRENVIQYTNNFESEIIQKKINSLSAVDHIRITKVVRQLLPQLTNKDLLAEIDDNQAIIMAARHIEKILTPCDNSIDVHLLNLAKDKAIAVCDLEGFERFDRYEPPIDAIFKILMCGNVSLAQTILELASSSIKRELIKMETNWKNGNLKFFDLLNKSSNDAQWMKGRNEVMANKIATLIQEHPSTFHVVGARHMVGEGSILSQLEAQGYSITRISV